MCLLAFECAKRLRAHSEAVNFSKYAHNKHSQLTHDSKSKASPAYYHLLVYAICNYANIVFCPNIVIMTPELYQATQTAM